MNNLINHLEEIETHNNVHAKQIQNRLQIKMCESQDVIKKRAYPGSIIKQSHLVFPQFPNTSKIHSLTESLSAC